MISPYAFAIMSLATTGAAEARPACDTIPALIARLRPSPVERHFTRELILLPFDELVSKAELVVEGVVQPVRTYLTEDRCYLYTDYVVSPKALLFGNIPRPTEPGPQPLIVRLIGGETVIDGVKVIVRDEHLPSLPPGQPVVLFLTKTANGNAYELVGSILGAFQEVPGNRMKSLVREEGVYADIASMSKAEFANEVKRVKSKQ